ncbi:MAG: hypothetical protein N4A45_08135 [Flavobacteriales bacterium]|jgi:hypothetical protein|nr:hypothetical protein [Flavobacteriales bacterium]
MLNLQSDSKHISASKTEILKKFENLEFLKNSIPDEVTNLKLDQDTVSFDIMGGTTISLKRNKEKNDSLSFVSIGKLNFDLVINLEEKGAQTESIVGFEGSFNPMVEMMAKKPLQNFINKLNQKLGTLDFKE